jgi:hypothetical protein
MKDARKIPVVRIETTSRESSFTTGHNTKVFVDGELWPTFAYKNDGGVADIQRVTLEFAAEVTVVHEEKP